MARPPQDGSETPARCAACGGTAIGFGAQLLSLSGRTECASCGRPVARRNHRRHVWIGILGGAVSAWAILELVDRLGIVGWWELAAFLGLLAAVLILLLPVERVLWRRGVWEPAASARQPIAPPTSAPPTSAPPPTTAPPTAGNPPPEAG